MSLTVRVGGMHLLQLGETHYHAQLRLPDKGRVKGLNNVRGLVPCCGQEGIKLKYRNTPQNYIQIHITHLR